MKISGINYITINQSADDTVTISGPQYPKNPHDLVKEGQVWGFIRQPDQINIKLELISKKIMEIKTNGKEGNTLFVQCEPVGYYPINEFLKNHIYISG